MPGERQRLRQRELRSGMSSAALSVCSRLPHPSSDRPSALDTSAQACGAGDGHPEQNDAHQGSGDAAPDEAPAIDGLPFGGLHRGTLATWTAA